MKILISGGAGFIGSHLVDKLLQDPENSIIVYDNLSRGKVDFIEPHFNNDRFTFIQSDLRNKEEINRAMCGVDYVFHLGAQSNVMGALKDPQYSFDTNVAGTLNVLIAAQECSVKRVIFSSSREVYGDAIYLPVDEVHPLEAKNLYGASKAAAEMYCRVFRESFDLDVLILRLANVFGKRDRARVIPIWIENANQDHDLIVYGGNQIIDFISVDIVVDVLQQSMLIHSDGKPINIGTGYGTAILDLAKLIIELTFSNSSIKIVESRKFEVRNFYTDTTRMQLFFNTRKRLTLINELKPLLGDFSAKMNG